MSRYDAVHEAVVAQIRELMSADPPLPRADAISEVAAELEAAASREGGRSPVRKTLERWVPKDVPADHVPASVVSASRPVAVVHREGGVVTSYDDREDTAESPEGPQVTDLRLALADVQQQLRHATTMLGLLRVQRAHTRELLEQVLLAAADPEPDAQRERARPRPSLGVR
ncbi:hypothetical protein [Cellulomonas sp. KRMCY2]|uniref:hypothetical protein n=1 Tax=Cellulomonas sp. KRMCY2 TaxID=1304865 RepID=UPI00045E7866|nr:hypothetical protein [Cellulomonas sp. KRMCY2]